MYGHLAGGALFARAVDAPGQAAHLAALNAGFTRQRLAEAIFSSEENKRNEVRGLYQRFKPAQAAGERVPQSTSNT